MVRIFMAVRTLIERNADVLRLAIRSVRMAFRALHLRMQPGQRVTRFRVVELLDLDRLPVLIIVALQAILAEPAFVLILVASNASSRESQISPIQILLFDCRPLLGGNMCRVVTLIASQPRMFAFQNVPGFLVIEGLDVPLDEWKVLAVMLGVAARTFLARS